jgi:hypothetical protein
MAGTLSAGVNSLILKLDTPYDTIRTADIRDDLIKVIVWSSTTAGFTPSNTNKVFDGLSLSIVIPNLTAGTAYYVRYAFISEIDESQVTYSSELTATPVASQTVDISGYSAFAKSITGTYTPANTTLTAITTGITSPVYAWTISGGTLSSNSTSSTVVTPSGGASSVSVTLSVTGAGLTTPITKSIVMAIVSDGATGGQGIQGIQGNPGTPSTVPGPRNASGYLYYQTATATAPGTPSASNYNFNTGQFATLTSAPGDTGTWGYSPISPSTSDTTLKAWVSRFYTAETTYNTAAGAAVIDTPSASINFNGIVTFTNFSTGTTPLATVASVNGKISAADLSATGTTVIDGGRITTGTIDANKLTIGNNAGNSANERIVLSSNKIEIFNNNVRRVVLGDLS